MLVLLCPYDEESIARVLYRREVLPQSSDTHVPITFVCLQLNGKWLSSKQSAFRVGIHLFY